MSGPAVMITIGVVCFAAFAFINLVVQPLWFPHELSGAANSRTSMQTRRAGAGLHAFLGVFLALLLLVGLILVAAGCIIIGTTAGYGPSR